VDTWRSSTDSQLPIDAVPDITNRQVQINTIAPALAPGQIERQVTYPLETALAGIPGLTSTRSLSRNGFSQVTAIFNLAGMPVRSTSRRKVSAWSHCRNAPRIYAPSKTG